jgi:hypothetical protein
MAVWVDGPKQKYDGCLVVMNIGQENIRNIPDGEKEEVVQAIAGAHAGGCSVVYVFDADIGPMGPPEEFDVIAGMDGVRMGFDVLGMRTIEFSSNPDERHTQMEDVGKRVQECLKDTEMAFNGPVQFCGRCLIGGQKAFVPLT